MFRTDMYRFFFFCNTILDLPALYRFYQFILLLQLCEFSHYGINKLDPTVIKFVEEVEILVQRGETREQQHQREQQMETAVSKTSRQIDLITPL